MGKQQKEGILEPTDYAKAQAFLCTLDRLLPVTKHVQTSDLVYLWRDIKDEASNNSKKKRK